jgi:hypothetical protein
MFETEQARATIALSPDLTANLARRRRIIEIRDNIGDHLTDAQIAAIEQIVGVQQEVSNGGV